MGASQTRHCCERSRWDACFLVPRFLLLSPSKRVTWPGHAASEAAVGGLEREKEALWLLSSPSRTHTRWPCASGGRWRLKNVVKGWRQKREGRNPPLLIGPSCPRVRCRGVQTRQCCQRQTHRHQEDKSRHPMALEALLHCHQTRR